MRRPIAAVMTGVALATGTIAGAVAQANLDAGKTPAQMFAQGCSACHRTPQELAPAGRDFLIQHYTTGPRQADAMAAYLQAVRSEPARAAKPRRIPTAEADIAEVTSTGSIGAHPSAATPAETPSAPVPSPLVIEE